MKEAFSLRTVRKKIVMLSKLAGIVGDNDLGVFLLFGFVWFVLQALGIGPDDA